MFTDLQNLDYETSIFILDDLLYINRYSILDYETSIFILDDLLYINRYSIIDIQYKNILTDIE